MRTLVNTLLAICLLTTPCGMADVTVVVGRPAPVSGPNTWYETTAATDASSPLTGDYTIWDNVVIAQGGIITALGVHCASVGTETIKLALYTSAGNLVSGAGGTVSVTSANNGSYVDVTGLLVPITAGTYRLAVNGNGSGTVSALVSGGTGHYYTELYDSFPSATQLADAGTDGKLWRLRVFVQ
jgi:hypothetical protein